MREIHISLKILNCIEEYFSIKNGSFFVGKYIVDPKCYPASQLILPTLTFFFFFNFGCQKVILKCNFTFLIERKQKIHVRIGTGEESMVDTSVYMRCISSLLSLVIDFLLCFKF